MIVSRLAGRSFLRPHEAKKQIDQLQCRSGDLLVTLARVLLRVMGNDQQLIHLALDTSEPRCGCFDLRWSTILSLDQLELRSPFGLEQPACILE